MNEKEYKKLSDKLESDNTIMNAADDILRYIDSHMAALDNDTERLFLATQLSSLTAAGAFSNYFGDDADILDEALASLAEMTSSVTKDMLLQREDNETRH